MVTALDTPRPACPRRAEALAAVTDLGACAWAALLAHGGAVGDVHGRRVVACADARRGSLGYRPLAITEVAEAFETLALRLDLEGWLDDPDRVFDVGPPLGHERFRVPHTGDDRWHLHYAGGATRVVTMADLRRAASASLEPFSVAAEAKLRERWAAPRPPSVAACVAFAGDAAGVVTAEAIARDVVAHVSDGREPSRVRWTDTPRVRPSWLESRGLATWDGFRELFRRTAAAVAPGGQPLADVYAWAEDNRVLGVWFDMERVVEAFAALAQTGYGFDAVADGVIVLTYPRLPSATIFATDIRMNFSAGDATSAALVAALDAAAARRRGSP
jgi:hypothetical protein